MEILNCIYIYICINTIPSGELSHPLETAGILIHRKHQHECTFRNYLRVRLDGNVLEGHLHLTVHCSFLYIVQLPTWQY